MIPWRHGISKQLSDGPVPSRELTFAPLQARFAVDIGGACLHRAIAVGLGRENPMGPRNHPESIASGAACSVGIGFGIDSVRSVVAAARVVSHENSDVRLSVKATRYV